MEGAESTLDGGGSSSTDAPNDEKKVVSEYAAWMEGAEDAMHTSEAKAKLTEFTATVAKKDGKLGMAINFQERLMIISEVIADSAVDVWNKQDEQVLKIGKGDCIIKANDVEVHTEQEF